MLFPNPVSNQFALRPKVCYEIISTTAIGNSFHDCPLYFFLSVNRKFSCKLLCRVSSRRAQIKSFLYLLLIKKRKGSPRRCLPGNSQLGSRPTLCSHLSVNIGHGSPATPVHFSLFTPHNKQAKKFGRLSTECSENSAIASRAENAQCLGI